jgi:hypothetical protein
MMTCIRTRILLAVWTPGRSDNVLADRRQRTLGGFTAVPGRSRSATMLPSLPAGRPLRDDRLVCATRCVTAPQLFLEVNVWNDEQRA